MTKGEHTNERTYIPIYIRTGQTLYPLHNFVVRGNNKKKKRKENEKKEKVVSVALVNG